MEKDMMERAAGIMGALREEAERHPDVWLYRDATGLIEQIIAAPTNEALTLEELRGMGGEHYYHVSLQGPGDHWEVMDTLIARNIQDYYYGERWLAYRRKPEEGEQA